MQLQHDKATRTSQRGILLTAAVAALCLLTAPAHAQFLINPTGGTNITSTFASNGTIDPDDGSSLRSLGGTFTFYGTGITSIYAQVGGYLSGADGYGFSSDRTVAALAGIIPAPVIAPFYDDFFDSSPTGNSVLEKIVAGSYYSLTYDVNTYSAQTAAGQNDKFQTVLFTGNTVVNGVAFQAGDVVFSYGSLNAPVQNSNFSVGVAQNGTNGTNAFGGTGQFTTTAGFTSNFNPSTQGLLFRPNAAGTSYTQSLTPLATPEPSQYAAFGLGVLGIGAMALKARRRSVLA